MGWWPGCGNIPVEGDTPIMRGPRIFLLGEPRLATPDGTVPAAPGPKAMALLACLASAPDMRMSRAALADLLWADARSTSAARHALRQCLVRLRAGLGDAGSIVVADDGAVWLDAHLVTVDLCDMLAASTDDDVVAASLAIRGRFCAGLDPGGTEFETWLRARRSEYDRASAELHGKAATILMRRGKGDAALAAARRRLALEPFEDEAHAALIALCVALGRRQEAAETHAACHETFRAELGVAPGPEVDAALRRTVPAPRDPVMGVPGTAIQPAFVQPVFAPPIIVQAAETPRPRAFGAFAAGLAAAALLQLIASWSDGRFVEPTDARVGPAMALWVGPAAAGAVRERPGAEEIASSDVGSRPGPLRSLEGNTDDTTLSATRDMPGGAADYSSFYPVGC